MSRCWTVCDWLEEERDEGVGVLEEVHAGRVDASWGIKSIWDSSQKVMKAVVAKNSRPEGLCAVAGHPQRR